MRKKLLMILTMLFIAVFSFSAFFLVACNDEKESSGENTQEQTTQKSDDPEDEEEPPIQSEIFDNKKLSLSDFEKETEIEVGERCDIPNITAIYDEKLMPVLVKVYNSENKKIPIVSRGTRFIASDKNGYKIKYFITLDVDVEVATVSVKIKDTVGPIIDLPAYARNIIVNKGEEVQIPNATITDEGGTVENENVVLSFNGQPVQYGGSGDDKRFTPNEYGTYSVTYSASDEKGNSSTDSIDIVCARNIELCNFDDENSCFGFLKEYKTEFSNEHVHKGSKTLKIDGRGTGNYVKIVVYPEYFDLSGFDRIQINLYSTKDVIAQNEGLCLLNKNYSLSGGDNFISISKKDLESEYAGGVIPSSVAAYNDQRYLWLQFVGSGQIYIDSIIGVFDNYTTDTKAPVIDLGRDGCSGTYDIKAGQKITVPFKAYDNSMENIAVNYTVKRNGADITSQVISGSVNAVLGETYTVTLNAKDGANNSATTKTVIYNVYNEEDHDETGREVKLLQGFEDENVANTIYSKRKTERVEYGVTEGSYSAKIYSINDWESVFLKVKVGNNVLTVSDAEKISYISMDVFSDKEGMLLYFYNLPLGRLKLGQNTVYISGANLKAQMQAEKTDADKRGAYDQDGWMFFQIGNGSKGFTINFDNIKAIYLKKGEDPGTPDVPSVIVKQKVLQSFETPHDSSVYVDSDLTKDRGNTALHHTEGNYSFVFTTAANWQMVLINLKADGIILTPEEVDKMDSISIDIYVELPEDVAGTDFFYFDQNMGWLVNGANTLTISAENFKTQMLNVKDKDAKLVGYREEDGWAYFQVAQKGVTLYLDNCVATYK